MKKGFKFGKTLCVICGEFIADNWYIRHLKREHPVKMEKYKVITLDRLQWRENIADTQHEIWAHWMRYLFSCSTEKDSGEVVIPKDKVDRWKRQIQTPYNELSEREKQSDRSQAIKVIDGLLKHKDST